MGLLARQRVEADYSVSAWAETFVTSMTGRSRRRRLALPGSSIGPARQRGLRVRAPRPQVKTRPVLSTRLAIDEPLHSSRTIDGRRRSDVVEAAGNAGPPRHPADVQASRMGVVAVREIGWWSRDGWGEVLLGAKACVWTSGANRAGSRRSNPGLIAWFIARTFPREPSTSSTSWCRIGGPCFGSGFAAEKGRNEGKRSQHLASIGVPTITPIALGEQRQRKFLFENYLVTLAISAAIPLDEFVEQHLPDRPEPLRSQVRQRLGQAMAVMTARLHDAGLLHQDFHPGNIMVRLAADHTPELFMIDLDALRTSRRVTWKLARQNLALLDHFFWLRSSRTDRYRFLKTYLRNRSEKPPDVRGFARRIEETTRLWAERLWRRWGRRCRSSNKYFEIHPGETRWCVASRDLDPAEIQPLLDDPDLPFRRPGDDPLEELADDDGGRDDDGGAGSAHPGHLQAVQSQEMAGSAPDLFRPSRAWRSWQAGQHLASRGIPTPQNLAFLSRRRSFKNDPLFWFLPHETYLITVKEENVVDLGTYTRKVLPSLPPDVRRGRIRSLTVSLAELIRSLHDRSLSHRDLKAVEHTDQHGFDRPVVSAQRDRSGRGSSATSDPANRRVQNLARLCISLEAVPGRNRTDVLRFLRLISRGACRP